MSSVEENQCIDPSLLVSEYPEGMSVEVSEYRSVDVEEPDFTPDPQATTQNASRFTLHEERVCETPLALSGNQCTQDTYVDASDFTPAKKLGLSGHGEPVESMTRASSPPAALGALCILCGCGGVSPGADPRGDGGFRFGGDDGGDDDGGDMPVDDPDDVDGDGYPVDKDCDDTDSTVHPRATETPYDGIDQDCNGEDVIDADGDGFIAVEADGDDCNDDQAYIHPGAEQRLTGFDTNCDGNLEIDLDRDSVKFVGENDGDRFGTSMAMGDVNGDGYGDVLISAPVDNLLYDRAGRAYVFFGGPDRLLPGSTLNANDADIVFKGACGWGLSADVVKDLDGDGMAEILMGLSGYNNNDCDPPNDAGDHSRSGAIFVVKGRETWESSYDFYEIDTWDEGTLADYQIGVIKGTNGLRLGGNILVTGDIDGDGVGQIVAGRGSQCDVIPARVYEGISRIDEVRDSEGGHHIYNNTGVGFNGIACDSLASGDFDGDGLSDLVLADGDDVLGLHDGAGRVSLLMGSESLPSDINLYSLETYSGLKYVQFSGNGPSYAAGGSMAAGDVDGDGKDELMIGVSGEDNPMESAGRVYCVSGTSITDVIEGDNPDFGNGDTVVLNGDVYDLGGLSFYSAFANANMPDSLAVTRTSGTMTGNLLIGSAAYFDSDPGSTDDVRAGRAFYFSSSLFGGGSPASEIPVSEATLAINAPAGDLFGASITGGGDANGDGVEDVLINAPKAPDSSYRGTTHLLFGGSR